MRGETKGTRQEKKVWNFIFHTFLTGFLNEPQNKPVCRPEEKARKSRIWRDIASRHGHLVHSGGQSPHDEVPQLLRGGVGGRPGLAVHQALVHAGGPAGVILVEQHTGLRVSTGQFKFN